MVYCRDEPMLLLPPFDIHSCADARPKAKLEHQNCAWSQTISSSWVVKIRSNIWHMPIKDIQTCVVSCSIPFPRWQNKATSWVLGLSSLPVSSFTNLKSLPPMVHEICRTLSGCRLNHPKEGPNLGHKHLWTNISNFDHQVIYFWDPIRALDLYGLQFWNSKIPWFITMFTMFHPFIRVSHIDQPFNFGHLPLYPSLSHWISYCMEIS